MPIPISSNKGKTMAAKMPFFRSSEAAADMYPTSVGPPEHPRSPPKASSANRAVPPFFREAEALLKLPGHMIPTERPQTPQPTKDSRGEGAREIHR